MKSVLPLFDLGNPRSVSPRSGEFGRAVLQVLILLRLTSGSGDYFLLDGWHPHSGVLLYFGGSILWSCSFASAS